MLFRFLILINVCAAFPFKCPEAAQWSLRARGHCPNPSKYFCLKNDLINGYSENCTVIDFLQPGRKHVLRGGLDADICSTTRFQPWPITFYTNVSTNCIFLKSICNEEGQVIYGKGNSNTDTSCRCDYTRGYNFLLKPRNLCFCVPSKEDCSCYIKTCPKSTDRLSPDYKCIRDEENTTVSECKSVIYKRGLSAVNTSSTGNILTTQILSYKVQLDIAICSICIGLTIAYCIGVLIIELCWKVLVIYEPPSDIQLIEGQNVELMYKLLINRRPSCFLKNNHFLPEKENIKKCVDGPRKILKIANVTPDDIGEYCLEVAGCRSRITNLIIQPMFTSKIHPYHCTEGDRIELSCSVYTDNIEVKWYKGVNEIHECTNISITSNGNHRMLTILETTVIDSGTYIVEAQNVVMKISLKVKAIFKQRLVDITNMEGLDTNLTCETEDKHCNVQWFRNNVEITDKQDRMQIETTEGRVHTLFISKTILEDSGTYSIKIKGVKSIAQLDVKAMPETINQMSPHDKEKFLKAAKSGITKQHTIRVMIVGEKSVGKTCLLRRLLNENINDVRTTDGINIERRKCQIDIETGEWHFLSAGRKPQVSADHIKQFADCGFWDFAGQRDFYATHQTFLSGNAVYLLVVDLSKDFTPNTFDKMIESEFDRIGGYIDFWLDNIHCYSRDDTNKSKHHNDNDLLNPPVIIVGTGIDKIVEVEKKKKDFKKDLSRILSIHAKQRHLRKPHFVSNMFPSDDKHEFKSLRDDIFLHAKALTTWGESLPTRWIVLEKEIKMKLAEHVISYTEAENLAMKCSFHDDSQMTLELDLFLKFEHDIGNIVFFEDVKSFIVLDPEWLIDIFKCFVSHQYDNNTFGMPEWRELEETGILADTLIAKLLEKVPDLCTPERKTFVLQIMEKFDIIVKPINCEAKNDLYMPCMIKAEPFHNIIGGSESENERKTSWFCLKFNFLPPAYFNHILVSFVKRKELFVDQNRRLRIYRNIGEFQLDKSGSQKLVICLSKNAIAMQVRQLNCIEDICFSGVKDILIDIVDSIKQRYGINIKYTTKFKCSDGIYNCKRIGLETVMETSEYRCKEHKNTMHSSKETYSSWLTEEEVENKIKNKSHRKCTYCENMSVRMCYDCNKVVCKDCNGKHKDKDKNFGHSIFHMSDRFILNSKFKLGNSTLIDMICVPNGELIAAEYVQPRHLMICFVSGKQRDVIQLESEARKLIVVDRNTVAVLLKCNGVAIVDIQQKHVQYIRHISIQCVLDSFIYIDNQFYVGEELGIAVIDMSGSLKRQITLSFTPCDMCYDVDSQRIYCINSDHSELICIESDGTIVFRFTDTRMPHLKELTIDNEGNVLVICGKKGDDLGCVIEVDSNDKSCKIVITDIRVPSNNIFCFNRLTNSVVMALHYVVHIYKSKT